jgi:hypothetical protein
MPTVAVRDLEIQQRENDLVVATFGRGFYILDDYSPLRHVDEASLANDAVLFPVKDAWMYIEAQPAGYREKGTMGHSYFTAPNPPFGAVFTYYLREAVQTRTQERRESERQLRERDEPVYYPSWDELRAEDREDDPAIILTVTDNAGDVVRRIEGPARAGLHRVAWDLRYPAFTPSRRGDGSGPAAVPGTYTVSLATLVDGELTPLAQPQTFQARPLGLATLAASDKAALLAFQQKLGRLQRAVVGADRVVDETLDQLGAIQNALLNTPGAGPETFAEVRSMKERLYDIQEQLTGDETVSSRAEFTPPSITDRVQRAVGGFWASSPPTATHRRSYEIAGREFEALLGELRSLIEVDMRALGERLEAIGAPWTAGRGVPMWRFEPM